MLSKTIVDFDIKTQLEFSKIARTKKLSIQFKHPHNGTLIKLNARNHLMAERDDFQRRLITFTGGVRNDFLYIFKQGESIKGMGRLTGEPFLFFKDDRSKFAYVQFDDELTKHDLTVLFDKVYNEGRNNG